MILLVVVVAGPQLAGPKAAGPLGGTEASVGSVAADPALGRRLRPGLSGVRRDRRDVQVRLDPADPGVADLGLAGTWSMTLAADGTIDLAPPSSFAGSRATGHTFSLAGSMFRTDLYYNDYCNSVGVYAWTRSNGELTFTSSSDGCAIRMTLLGTHPWSEGATTP